MENNFYQKKDHKVTIKRYGFFDWYCYNMENFIWFRILITTISLVIGVIVVILIDK